MVTAVFARKRNEESTSDFSLADKVAAGADLRDKAAAGADLREQHEAVGSLSPKPAPSFQAHFPLWVPGQR